MKYSRIIGTGGYLPSMLLTNADLAEIAAKRAIEASGIDRNKIQLIIVATCTPHNLFPNTASYLQSLLGITDTACPAFDINVACSGFIYALSIADQYIRSGAIECALVVGADSLTKFVYWSDRSTCILFSDGAGAVVLKADDKPGVYSTHLHTDGSYGNLLYISGNTSKISEN